MQKNFIINHKSKEKEEKRSRFFTTDTVAKEIK